jgi:hypothetical protein
MSSQTNSWISTSSLRQWSFRSYLLPDDDHHRSVCLKFLLICFTILYFVIIFLLSATLVPEVDWVWFWGIGFCVLLIVFLLGFLYTCLRDRCTHTVDITSRPSVSIVPAPSINTRNETHNDTDGTFNV